MDVPYIVFILFLLLLSGLYWKNPKRTYFVIAIWVVLFFIGFRSRVVGGADSINYVRFFTGEQNFYNINDEFRIVDLPGYGYAKVSKSMSKDWGPMMEEYFQKRSGLKRVVQLVDIRHAPSAQDVQMYQYLRHYGLDGTVVATKADKISRNEMSKCIAVIRRSLDLSPEDTVICLLYTSDAADE